LFALLSTFDFFVAGVITLSLLHPIKQIPVQVWTFENESTIRIGRSTDNQVILYSAVVSRHHVELRRVGNSWEIVNLGTNGTYLDGKRITQVPVSDGAIIRLARSGPNIQIRIGAEALKDLQKTMQEERTVSQPRPDDPIMSTEITGQSGINDETLQSDDDKPTAGRANRGVIPVPPHLRLADEDADTIAIPSLPPEAPGAVSSRSGVSLRPMATKGRAVSPATCTHPHVDALFCPDCGQPMQSLGKLGEYKLVSILGQGHIGVTYLAWNGNKMVALKTLRDLWKQEAKAHIALECEAEILRQINHPRIPQLLDFFFADEYPLLIMELIMGDSLATKVRKQGAIAVHQAIAWVQELCKVLEYLHSFTPPLVHRGLWPHALIPTPLLHAPYALTLVDFGIVKYLALEEDFVPEMRAYVPPEAQLLEGEPTIDLYALGPILAYLISGHNPLSFCIDRGSGYRFQPDLVPGLPASLIPILQTITHPDPMQRYPTSAAVTHALQDVMNELAAETTPC
jgi:serine/threonine-protein kinase